MSEEKRTLTIARGLGRIKTIEGQLQHISAKIAKYGAGSSETKFALVDTRVSLKENHEKAREEVASLYQQHRDLTKEIIKIKSAIEKANFTTSIEIGGKVMTISEALITKRYIAGHNRNLVTSFSQSVAQAERVVMLSNNKLSADLDDEKRKALTAEVVYLVSPEQVNGLDEFLITFLSELDATLNEVNAITIIELD